MRHFKRILAHYGCSTILTFLSCLPHKANFFLSQTSTIDRKLVSENMKMRCFIHWRKFFFGERMSSTHLYNIVTKCCCCSRLLSNKEFCTLFPVEEMPVYAPWACTMQWQKDAKEAMIPISALFLAKAQLYKKKIFAHKLEGI